ncbi:MAG: SIMPL domain-containing protein [Candidatus Adlerbacteria bacterium]|nr:SIMPL domain-containing protein [Candidatus Adlerbacteria bacterium]MDZ4226295.1 SIMPL domain-containing protein [Patescibacteria group bacterium]
MFETIMGDTTMRRVVLTIAVALAAFLGIKATAELMELPYIGAGVMPANTISVSGYGEAVAVPDIATFTYSVVSEKSTVAAAQDDATTKSNTITDYLKGAGVAERDIQTTGYSVYPQYDWVQMACTPGGICPPGEQRLRGYEVRQSTTVKVRDTAKAGDLLAGVGSHGATEVSGLNFTFDDRDAVETEAREEAIADAKQKAEVLARQLGVRLVRVVSFSESGGYPTPIYYAKDTAMGMGGAEPARAPEISVGENKVTSNVSVTYEIR